MRWHAMLVVLFAIPDARANPPSEHSPPFYDQHYRARFLVGMGADPHQTGFGTLTAELGQSPFHGALSTGAGLSSATAFDGAWNVLTPYIYGRFDVIYPFITKLWSREPMPLRFRAHLGVRLGMDVSESFRKAVPTAETSYVLIRPAAQLFKDFEWALDKDHDFSIVARIAIDFPLSFETPLRTSGTIGFAYCWGGVD